MTSCLTDPGPGVEAGAATGEGFTGTGFTWLGAGLAGVATTGLVGTAAGAGLVCVRTGEAGLVSVGPGEAGLVCVGTGEAGLDRADTGAGLAGCLATPPPSMLMNAVLAVLSTATILRPGI